MPDINKLNEIFKQADESAKANEEKTLISILRKMKHKKQIRQEMPLSRREKRSGCLGGLMYFLFISCIAFILAVFAWMAASDVLALNNNNFEVEVTLPQEIFTVSQEQSIDKSGKNVIKEVTKADTNYVTELLYKYGLINYRWLFKFYCNISHAENKLDPGDYLLKSSYDYRALVQNMRESTAGLGTVDVTIPEGFNIYQIFKKFDEEGVAKYDDLLEAAKNSNFKYSFLDETLVGNETRLEGFLFPDTYQFYVGMEPSSAINKLLQTFYYKINADMLKQCDNLGYSLKDVIIVASIIEKEAGTDEERSLVASVIYNRLRSGWQLGMDSTILYIHQDHEGEPTAEMLDEDSPYNTRMHRGLPPTPICNPGIASINAALNPAQTNYYYFAADNDNYLHFFTDSSEFNAFASELNNGNE